MRMTTAAAVVLALLVPPAPALAAGTAQQVPNPLGGGYARPAPAGIPRQEAPQAPAASGTATFPRAVDPRYASEPAGKARQQTCLDQYNANKAGGGNGGLRWIQKGGGYYSECNRRLKG